MWFQSMRIPDALHARRTNTLCCRHCSHAPMGCRFWFGLQGSVYDLLDLFGCDSWLPAAAGGIVDQCRWSAGGEALSPEDDRWATRIQSLGNLPIGPSVRRQQNYLRSKNHFLWRVTSRNPCFQRPSLLRRDWQCIRHHPHRKTSMHDSRFIVKLFVRHYTSWLGPTGIPSASIYS